MVNSIIFESRGCHTLPYKPKLPVCMLLRKRMFLVADCSRDWKVAVRHPRLTYDSSQPLNALKATEHVAGTTANPLRTTVQMLLDPHAYYAATHAHPPSVKVSCGGSGVRSTLLRRSSRPRPAGDEHNTHQHSIVMAHPSEQCYNPYPCSGVQIGTKPSTLAQAAAVQRM